MIGTTKMKPLLFTFFNWNQNQNWATNKKTITFVLLVTREKSQYMFFVDCLCFNFDFWFQMIGVFGYNIGYLLEVIHMFKSWSRDVDVGKCNLSL